MLNFLNFLWKCATHTFLVHHRLHGFINKSTLLYNNLIVHVQIIPSLLDVFVGIEMTGQSVQFEQKFNYRRPMYNIMDYLWTLPEQREVFKWVFHVSWFQLSRVENSLRLCLNVFLQILRRNLAVDAEENMEAVNPPLFLRFINILMNDAIFLLDEALSNMAQLRSMQQAQ